MIRIDAASLVVSKLPKCGVFRVDPEMWQATVKGTEDAWFNAPLGFGGFLRVKHTRLREFSASGRSREDALCALGNLVSELGAVA